MKKTEQLNKKVCDAHLGGAVDRLDGFVEEL